jgi:hypothetical protein
VAALAPIERGESAFDDLVDALRAGADDPAARLEACLEPLTARAARARGLTSAPPSGPFAPAILAHDTPAWAEPHALGWIHQRWFKPERDASFARHTGAEDKHDAPLHATQIYTPRWVADALARRALSLSTSPRPSTCDPACGPGQMLLAALDALATRDPDASAEDLAACLHGADLDPLAIACARAALTLRLRELFGDADAAACAPILDTQIVCADGLSHHDGPFDVVLANPPYMGARAMPPALRARLKRDFSGFHQDLCVAFMRRCVDLSAHAVGLLVQQTVWYLARYERARASLLDDAPLDAFYHLGTRAFGALSGEKANVSASVHGRAPRAAPSEFVDLREVPGADAKRAALAHALATGERVTPRHLDALAAIPGAPLAYWLPDPALALFASAGTLGDLATIPGSQNKTGANARFVRAWADAPPEELRRADHLAPAGDPEGRWVFYSKGGRFAPWWGNWGSVVDWSDDARAFYASNRTSNLLDPAHWFVEGLCYTDFAGSSFNARWMPAGCLFDMTGPAIFLDEPDPARRRVRLLALLAALNSTPARALLGALNPSIHYQVRDLRNLPLPDLSPHEPALATRAERLVDLTRQLHALVPGDPLHDASIAPTDAAALGADLRARIRQAERELDALVRELYAWPGGAPELPEHHVVKGF